MRCETQSTPGEEYEINYSIGVTLRVASLVGVIVLGVDATIVDDELEGVVHEPSIAAVVVCSVAVN